MIIRSQDKTGIVIYENVIAIYVIEVFDDDYKEWFEIRYSGNDVSGTLGEYSTEAKAIKVLDMIEAAHRSMSFTDSVVFRMPQDSEV